MEPLTYLYRIPSKEKGRDELIGQVALKIKGPVIAVVISPTQQTIEQFMKERKAIPETKTCRAILDTGSQITSIDTRLANKMKLPKIEKREVMGTDTKTWRNIYPLHIVIPDLEQVADGQIIRDVFKQVSNLKLDFVDLEHVIFDLAKFSLLVHEEWKLPSTKTRADALVAWLHVTNNCNLRCAYCYIRRTSEKMTLETGRKSIDAVFRSARPHGFKTIKLKFAGGEPALNFQLVAALYDYAYGCAMKEDISLQAQVLSNGVAITSELTTAMLKRGMHLMVSPDDIAARQDSQRAFIDGQASEKIVLRTLKHLQEAGLAPHISITFTSRNIDSLAGTVRYLLEQRVHFSFNFMRDNEYSTSVECLHLSNERALTNLKSVFQIIEDQLPEWSLLGALADRANFAAAHEKTCGVGENYLVIDQRGNIAKCHMTMEHTVGTINDSDPIALVRADQLGVLNLTVDQKESCRDCTWQNWCTGGCPLLSYRMTGRYDIKSPNCKLYSGIFPDILRLEGLRILRSA